MRVSIQFYRVVASWLALTAVSVAGTGHTVTVELQTAAAVWQGRSMAHDQRSCWLLDSAGALHEVPLKDVTAYRKLDTRFRPETVVETRDRLARQIPDGMELTARGRYVILGPKGATTAYAQLLENVYNEFWSHFSKRQFGLQQPEFPLVVVIFPSQRQFAEYAVRDGAGYGANLKGYYNRASNRIAMYAEGTGQAAVSTEDSLPSAVAHTNFSRLGDIFGAVEGSFRDTLIHEATHQLAYNTNLHSRIGDHPRWVSEGLAMLFEADSRRDDNISRDPSERINRGRYLWFMNYRQSRRPKQALRTFIAGDELFRQSGLDAYSEAWALSFYLIETRRSEYRRYLQTVAARDPLLSYTPEDRLADFQSAFGRDIEYLEGQYLLFYDKIGLR